MFVQESQSQGTINWFDVYVATCEGLPDVEEVAVIKLNFYTFIVSELVTGHHGIVGTKLLLPVGKENTN